jgi:hypothetical protein
VTRAVVALLLGLAAGGTSAAERYAVIAVGDAPAGPDGDLAEMAYQLRAACRDRVPNVEDPPSMRSRLLGQGSGATESELDRAYGGALAVAQNGEFESSLRTLRAIVEDLESMPETEESYYQWKRGLLRLAHSALASNEPREAELAFGKLARVEPGLQPDADQFSPGFRKRFEEAKSRVRALPRRKLTVTAQGRSGTVFVNGKPMGTTPVTVTLPSGSYRVGGAAGVLRVPSFRVDLGQEDGAVVLDFALAGSLRMNAGPGLALSGPGRADGLVRAGAWLGVDKLLVVSRTEEGQAQFLVGSIYDVLRGALMREGSVRMVAGGVPSINLSALAAFLLHGQSSREVKDLSREGAKRPPPLVAGAPAEPTFTGGDVRTASAAASPPPVQAPAPTTAPPPAVTAPPLMPPVARPAATAAAPDALPPPAVSVVQLPAPPAPPPASQLPTADQPPLKPTLDPRPAPREPASQLADSLKPSLAAGADPSGPPTRRPRAWMGPTAIGAGVLSAGLAIYAFRQKGASDKAYSEADQQIGPSGAFKDAAAQKRWHALRDEASEARRNAVISGSASVAFAVAAGVLGWNALHVRPDGTAVVDLRF